jgi:peroxiredoxin
MKNALLFIVATALALAAVGYSRWSYLSSLSEAERLGATSDHPIVGRPAPGFSLPDLSGGAGGLASGAGRPAIVDFWTTWCGLCIKEFPVFQEFYRTYGSSIVFLSVCSGSSTEKAAELVAENGVTFPVLYDEGKVVARAYQPPEKNARREVTAFPFTVFVDSHGKVVYAKAGIFRSLDELVSLLRRLGFPVDATPS